GAAEGVLDLFRKTGKQPSLVRVGQEGVISDPLLPHHTTQVEALYRERLRARLKENYQMAGRRLGLPPEFIEIFFQIAVTLHPVLRQIKNLDIALNERRLAADEHTTRLGSLHTTAGQIMTNLGLKEWDFAPKHDAEDWFEEIVAEAAANRGVVNREQVRRLLRVMRLADDWLGPVGRLK